MGKKKFTSSYIDKKPGDFGYKLEKKANARKNHPVSEQMFAFFYF
jgi:hypothetical protein